MRWQVQTDQSTNLDGWPSKHRRLHGRQGCRSGAEVGAIRIGARRRRHCASRLQTLYKLLKMQHGRTKYQKRKLEVANIRDVK